jgi:hypothetical protein
MTWYICFFGLYGISIFVQRSVSFMFARQMSCMCSIQEMWAYLLMLCTIMASSLLSGSAASIKHMAQHGTTLRNMAQHGTPQHKMAQHGTAWHDMAHVTTWHMTACHNMAQYGTSWYSMAQHGTKC